MTKSLKEKLEDFSRNLDENNWKSSMPTSRLPIAILYCKTDTSLDEGNVTKWFSGSSENLHSFDDECEDEILNALNEIRYHLKNKSDQDAIVIENAADKKNGDLMAKLTGFFDDMYYIETAKELALIDDLYSFTEKLPDVISTASQLDSEIWEAYDYIRLQLTEQGLDSKKISLLTKEIVNIKYGKGDLIENAKLLLDRLKI